jgi:hypothetical protein
MIGEILRASIEAIAGQALGGLGEWRALARRFLARKRGTTVLVCIVSASTVGSWLSIRYASTGPEYRVYIALAITMLAAAVSLTSIISWNEQRANRKDTRAE